MSLEEWGWNEAWAAEAAARPGSGAPGRVVAQERGRWTVQTAEGPVQARLAPGSGATRPPVVGDWVLLRAGLTEADPCTLTALLRRTSQVSRGAAGSEQEEQVLAANVDVVWVVHGLDRPLNPRSLERYLAVVWESGAVPEVVLTKADLAADASAAVARAIEVAPGAAVRAVSTGDPLSVEALRSSLRPGRTVALLGPSGAGKSTLVNLLAGEERSATAEVRGRDRKGRHTTTRRELHPIAGGALLLDTPGLRELRLWAVEEGLGQAFPEIEDLAGRCRFGDCRHESEPGCAVTAAVGSGLVPAERLESYRKLRAEAEYQARKDDPLARKAAVAEHKSALKTLKHHLKYRDGV